MRRLLAALACVFLAAFAGRAFPACDPGGIGGTGIQGDGGIGGTGLRAESELGVFGVITGFASICVNGIELHYDAATPVSLNGEPVQASALALGQVVLVRAVANEKQTRARAIHIVDAAAGAAETAGALLQVGGQRVRIEPSTVFGAGVPREQLAGQALRVSGLRAADGSIVATRIDSGPAGGVALAQAPDLGAGRFSVQGYVSDVQQQNLRIAGMSFEVPSQLAAQLERDRLVRVSGRTESGRRIVERADVLSGALNPRPERSLGAPPRPGRESNDRRGSGGSGRDGDRSGRSGRH